MNRRFVIAGIIIFVVVLIGGGIFIGLLPGSTNDGSNNTRGLHRCM